MQCACKSDHSKSEIYFCSYNTCLSKARCKVECIIGMLKEKFACLTTPIHYQPAEVCHIVKAYGFLWNFGIMTGDNIEVEDVKLLTNELESTTGGTLCHNTLCHYLWVHKS